MIKGFITGRKGVAVTGPFSIFLLFMKNICRLCNEKLFFCRFFYHLSLVIFYNYFYNLVMSSIVNKYAIRYKTFTIV